MNEYTFIPGEGLEIKAREEPTRKRRLKKDCPCQKCHAWRINKAVNKLQKALSVSHTPVQLMYGGPLQVEPLRFSLSKAPAIENQIMIGEKK